MKANEKAASAVEKLIKALPKSERVDYTDKAEIEKARTAYDELTDDQKKLVSNLDTLTAGGSCAPEGARRWLRRINLRRKL